MSNENQSTPSLDNVLKQSVRANLAFMAKQKGFKFAEERAIEVLVDLFYSYVDSVVKTSLNYCEHSNRTKVICNDVEDALIDVSDCKIAELYDYHIDGCSDPVAPVEFLHHDNKQLPVLKVGKKRKFPSYISEGHGFPPFPDPHTYIRTTLGVKPDRSYVNLRKRCANQKRDVELALTQCIARSKKSQLALITTKNDEKEYPLIEVEPSPFSFLDALLPNQDDLTKIQRFHQENNKNLNESDESSSKDSEEMPSQKAQKSSTSLKNPYLMPVKKFRTFVKKMHT